MWERSSQGNQLMFWSALEVQDLSVGMDLWVSMTLQCQQMPWMWESYSYGNWKLKEESVLLSATWYFPYRSHKIKLSESNSVGQGEKQDMGSFMMEAPSLLTASC